jgi:hypothetical protein
MTRDERVPQAIRRSIDYGAFGFDLPGNVPHVRRGSVILLKDEPDRAALFSRGVILRWRLAFLSAAHTENDVKRLARGIFFFSQARKEETRKELPEL